MQNRQFTILKSIIVLFLTLPLNCFLFNPVDVPAGENYHYVHSKSEIAGEWVLFYSHLQWRDG
jgi:hypothetical protein